MTTPRQLPLDKVPSAFRRFVGDGRLVQIDSWRGTAGSWTIDAGHAPIRLGGTHQVTAVGPGCSYAVTGEVQVTLPVVAGRPRPSGRDYLGELIRAEQKFAAEWLTGMMGDREGRDHG